MAPQERGATDTVRIVVQVYPPWHLGIGAMTADGFDVRPGSEPARLERRRAAIASKPSPTQLNVTSSGTTHVRLCSAPHKADLLSVSRRVERLLQSDICR